MAVNRRTRYEVLKRDNFKCRYCRTTEGELHVDHVLPVALGGTDDPDNLVASCQACNSGKGSTSPTEETVADVSEKHSRWAQAMKDAALVIESQLNGGDDFVALFDEHWPRLRHVPSDYETSLASLQRAGLTEALLLDAITAATGARNVNDRFAYFCGVAWRHVREVQAVAKQLMEVD